MEEHLRLAVGDVIKIKRGSHLFTPEETPLTVVHIFEGNQYQLDWPGRTNLCTVLMQYAVDKYARKLFQPPDAAEKEASDGG